MWRGGLWFSVLLEAPSARTEARADARRRRRDAFIALLRDALLVAEWGDRSGHFVTGHDEPTWSASSIRSVMRIAGGPAVLVFLSIVHAACQQTAEPTMTYPATKKRRCRRRLLRHEGRRPVPLDGGSRLEGDGRLGGGAERGHRSRISTSCRCASASSSGSPSSGTIPSVSLPVVEGGRYFYAEEQRACSARRRSTCAPASRRAADARPRSERDVAGRLALARAVDAVARRQAARLRPRRKAAPTGRRSTCATSTRARTCRTK